MRKNILITGLPKSGKSTLLKNLLRGIDKKIGFVTNEIIKDGQRTGFEIETHDCKKSILASVNFKTNFKVSRYYVDIKKLEKTIPKVEKFNHNDLLFLDEIGQMQLFSKKFKKLALKYLDAPNTCIATLSKIYSDQLIKNIKKRSDIFLIEINKENRDKKEKYIEALLSKITKAKKYISDTSRFTVKQNKIIIKSDHSNRTLIKQKGKWICDCEFFKKNKICSHFIALEKYLKDA